MAQLSRPFQIALVALVLFVLVWFAALHRPGSSGSTSPSATAATPARASGSHAAAPHSATPAHPAASRATATHSAAPGATATHSAAPGATTPDSAARGSKAAHAPAPGATATHAAAHRAAHSATAGTPHSGTPAHTDTAASATKPAHSETSHGHRSATAAVSPKPAVAPQRTQPAQRGSAAAAPTHSTPAMQATVAAELKHGKVVLVLFWNSHASDDRAVHGQLEAVAHKLGRSVVVHTATASEVGSFGSITRAIQVYQTPTLLIVNRHAQVTTLTGYTDAYAIEQAIREARG